MLRKIRLVKTDFAKYLAFGFLVDENKEVVEVPVTTLKRNCSNFASMIQFIDYQSSSSMSRTTSN